MPSILKGCRECGFGFRASQRTTLFCSTACRAAFNRRRHDRGAELYDLMMVNSFETPHNALRPEIQNLVTAYRDADKALRCGRPSWQPWEQAKIRLPMSYGKEGDGR
jgi:hypothetical protein